MPQLVSHKAPKRYCLLSLMSIFMIGSAVWLKLILFAELWVKVSMRHTELLVLLAIGVAVMVVTGGVVGEIF